MVKSNLRALMSLLMILFITSSGIFAQTKEEQSVALAVESLRKAMVDADKASLERLTADGLSYGHSTGRIENKQEFIEALLSGKSDFVTIELTNQTIKVYGKTAIVRHIFSAQTNDDGKPNTVKLSILLVWQKEKDQWKLLARQAVKVV